MVIVPVVIKDVTLKVLSLVGCTALLKLVARVPSIGGLEANPAEMVPTFSAGHIVATPVFLNEGLAFRALFCVYMHPIQSLRIIATLLLPILQLFTLDRVVPIFQAREAKQVTTATPHSLCP